MSLSTRLKWIRERLKLSVKEVAIDNSIHESTFRTWEISGKPTSHRKVFELAEYFNELWIRKYIEGYPYFEGKAVSRITLEFILIGSNTTVEQCNLEIKELIMSHYEEIEKIRNEITGFNTFIISPPISKLN